MDQAESTLRPERACSVRPDPIDLRDVPYRPGVASAPRLELFPPRLGRVKDQLHTSACTGYALATVIELLLERAERETAPSISPFMLYSMARRFDEVKGNEDLDLGSSVRGALKGWARFGACAEALWSAATMPQATNEPGQDWWLDAVKRPLGAYYRVDPQNLGHMQTALSETTVLYASAAWHDGWESGRNVGAGKPAPSTFADVWEIPHAQAGAEDQGHAFVIVGYNARGFLIQNSWGAQWGSGGFALLTYRDWLTNGMDCWAVQLGVPTEDHLAISQAPSLRYAARTGVALASAPVLAQREVAPFIVDMENNGELSSSGLFRTQDDDLRALVDNHLPQALKTWELASDQPIDVAVFAHGGINSESDAYEHAVQWIPKLYGARIFPAFLMWENDIWSSLKDIISDALREQPRLTGAGLPDPLAQLGVRKFLNTRTERLVSRPGMPIWEETRGNAMAIGQREQSGARKLMALLRASPLFPRLRVHLISHSAGAIAQIYLAEAMVEAGWKIDSVISMAPAARISDFADHLSPHLQSGGVKRYLQFHLTDDRESTDREFEPLYGRSLLFLVSEAFEGGAARPMLGMQRYFAQSRVPASPAQIDIYAAPGEQSQSVSHSEFPRDPATLNTVIGYIKQAAPSVSAVAMPPARQRAIA